MAALTLDSLVLRGMTVPCGGKAGVLCRGTSCPATVSTPEIVISMRHPSLGWQAGLNPAATRPDQAVDHDRVAQAAIGAGRSLSRVGVSHSRGNATAACRATFSPAARLPEGGKLPIAIALADLTVRVVALGGETSPKRPASFPFTRTPPSGRTGAVRSGKRGMIGTLGRTRIPPASTRETGLR
jgi:hypothetical protein